MSAIREIRDCDVRVTYKGDGFGSLVIDGVELAGVLRCVDLRSSGRSAEVGLQLAVDDVEVRLNVDVTSLACTARVTGNTVQLLKALVAAPAGSGATTAVDA